MWHMEITLPDDDTPYHSVAKTRAEVMAYIKAIGAMWEGASVIFWSDR